MGIIKNQKQVFSLSKLQIQAAIDRSGLKNKVNVHVFEEIDSTNQWIKDNSLMVGNEQLLCVAESQSSGRGRSGRSWVSPEQSNVYMSFSYLPGVSRNNISPLSLVIGLALVRVLSRKGVLGLSLKWPNDVLLNGKKLAGILIESQLSNRELVMIIGIGVNVRMPVGIDIDSDIGWADLSNESSECLDRNEIIADLYTESMTMISKVLASDFSIYKAEWKSYDAFANKAIKVIDRGVVTNSGINAGIDENGCLLISSPAGVKKVYSGDVSLRLNKHD